MPRFTELIDKIGRNEPLTAGELSDLRRQGEAIDEVVSLVKSWITTGSSTPFIQNLRAENIFVPSGEVRLGTPAPGQGFSGVRIAQPPFTYNGEEWNIAGVNDDVLQVGIRASDGKLVFGGGDGHLDEFGLTFQNQEGFVQFLDTDDGGTMQIYGDGFNELVLKNEYGGAGIRFDIDTDAHGVLQFVFTEDGSQAGRSVFLINTGVEGARFAINAADEEPHIDIRTEGNTVGSTFIRMRETTRTPDNPGDGDAGHFYIKGNKFIIQWNDGGTVRYKFLDMTGVGITWQHTTTPP